MAYAKKHKHFVRFSIQTSFSPIVPFFYVFNCLSHTSALTLDGVISISGYPWNFTFTSASTSISLILQPFLNNSAIFLRPLFCLLQFLVQRFRFFRWYILTQEKSIFLADSFLSAAPPFIAFHSSSILAPQLGQKFALSASTLMYPHSEQVPNVHKLLSLFIHPPFLRSSDGKFFKPSNTLQKPFQNN